jgi:hypothetical protein
MGGLSVVDAGVTVAVAVSVGVTWRVGWAVWLGRGVHDEAGGFVRTVVSVGNSPDLGEVGKKAGSFLLRVVG